MAATSTHHYGNDTDMELERRKFNEELRVYLQWTYGIKLLLILIGTLSSLFVCFVMKKGTRTREKLSYSNYFIFHLSLSDPFLRAVGILDLVLSRKDNQIPIQCKFLVLFQFTSAATGFVLLAGISIDRHNNICNPFGSLSAKQRHGFVITTFWLYALIVSTGFISSTKNQKFGRRIEGNHGYRNCTASPHQGFHVVFSSHDGCIAVPPTMRSQLVFTIYFSLAFVVPLLTMIVMYTRVSLFLWKRSRNKTLNVRVVKSKSKAIFMLTVIVLIFGFSWGPLMFVNILLAYGVFGKFGPRVFGLPLPPLAESVSYISSVLKSIVYAFGNSKFRRKAKYLLRKIYRSTRVRVGCK